MATEKRQNDVSKAIAAVFQALVLLGISLPTLDVPTECWLRRDIGSWLMRKWQGTTVTHLSFTEKEGLLVEFVARFLRAL